MIIEAVSAIEKPLHVDDPNLPWPELGSEVETLFETMHSVLVKEQVAADPAMQALHIQTTNHLRHVRFDFVIDPESPDYTHDYVLDGPYAYRPTMQAVAKTSEFFTILNASDTESIGYTAPDTAREAELEKQQRAVTRKIINDPLGSYAEFKQRLDTQGMEASFPEFASTVELLRQRMLSGGDVQEVCQGNLRMEKFRSLTLAHLDALADNGESDFPYTTTVLTIERAMEFFDVVKRAQMGDEAPGLYHSGRYEYYFPYLLARKDHIIFPTSATLGATDLIKVRGVPIGFIGVNTDTERVDGFKQTPYEFFHHDVNHSRRMYQFFSETAAAQGMTILEFAAESNAFINQSLLPLILPHKDETPQDKNRRIATRMLIFEMVHEDALAASPAAMAAAIMRPAMLRTPFERIDNDKTVTYVMEPGATTLAYVFRKLAHTFYDSPDQRYDALGDEAARSRLEIVKAGVDLYRTVTDDDISDIELLKRLEQLVATDEGFPEAFMAEVLDDMKIRGENRHDTTFIVSKPTSPDTALERIRSSGRIIHSIFGFSGLGYRHPDDVMQAVENDLRQLNPDITTVAIGATEEGIGAAYKVARDLGFTTLGIVSSKSIVYDGRYSDFVDEVVIVHDTEWGGYVPGSTDMTPTTQVFVKGSDSIAAYGGGQITAVSIREAKKRGVKVTYTPAEMNPDNIERDNANASEAELRGAAYAAWQSMEGDII